MPDRGSSRPSEQGTSLDLERSGQGPVVVLVHGVAGSKAVWAPLVPLLDGGYTVVTVDLAGYGHSLTRPGCYSPAGHTDAIRDTLRQAGIAPPYILVGLSMGANLVLTYGCRWPDEVHRIVGIGFPYFADRRAAEEGLGRNFWTRQVTRHPRSAPFVIPGLWTAFRRSGLTRWHRGIYTPNMAYEALLADYEAFSSSTVECMLEFDYAAALAGSAELPRSFIHGSRDNWSSAEAVSGALAPYPSNPLTVIDGAPHNVVVTEPARTAAAILDYLGTAPAPQGERP